ncbi:TPA: hypothetical protein IAC10_12215 [Candidatus Scatousia excrementigallinarum]|uniref:DUF4340 domain-containing protein n=1 Tax=Candidatus Scatousia excrementigallinarum TaxID=2840935 RepID=A0A9D1F0Y3_9BACT|nr:hypothetical protein [Candidatus Scatousia excrementigallinarum]
MKKTLTAAIAGVLLLGGLSVSALDKKSETLALLPAMKYESAAPNRIWVGTFQLVWNDLMDGIVKGPVEFKGKKSKLAEELNAQSFTKEMISENSYYTKYGETSPELRDTIEKAIKEKFDETSDVLNSVDWAPGPNKYTAYAMLKKDFKFLTAFDKLKMERFGKNKEKVQYFGINKKSDKILDKTVHVMFYNSSKDFAVVIYTQTDDVLYLYRTKDDKTFDKLYSDMFIKRAQYEGNSDFTEKDELKVPNIGLYKEQSFDELCNREIKGTNMMLDKALETVEFKMDNEGVKLKSEAIIATKMSAMLPEKNLKPRKFYFDDTFVIFLQEQGKDKPYFAMRVNDVAAINKTERKK